MATQCIVKLVTINEFTVQVTGAITLPPVTLNIPREDVPFTDIFKIVRTNIQGRLTELEGVLEMITSMVFALRVNRNPPVKTQVQTPPLTTLVFCWGGEVKPNITMTLTNTPETRFTINVHYMVGSDNITVPVVVNRVKTESEMCVSEIMRELERNIRCPRPYLLAMTSMVFCLWSLQVSHCSKVHEFTTFSITQEPPK